MEDLSGVTARPAGRGSGPIWFEGQAGLAPERLIFIDETDARFTALMYSVVATLATNGINVRRWLEAWLEACAKNGGKPLDDLSPWLPCSMSEERRRALMAPG